MDFQTSYAENKQSLTRIWTERLYKEYENILFHFGVQLVRPQIVITENTSILGLWSPDTRTVSVSRKLIETHPWDIVIEVLKHEMAHQIVSEYFKFYDQHGTLFKKACTMLAVADWAASATGKLPNSIPSWRQKSLSDEDEKILKRAEKLLSLAESANEHEASLAMRRVRELYEKYNIEHIKTARQSELVWTVLTRRKKKTDIVDSMILSILNKHFFVRVVHTTLYEAKDCQEYKAAEIMGSRQNVLMAEYVYDFLRQKIQALCKEYKLKTNCSVLQSRSYAVGLLTGFMQKLDKEAEKPHSSETVALVKVCDRQINEFLKFRHPKLTHKRYGASYRDSSSFENGKSDGNKISISKGVGHTSTNSGRFLTSK